MGWRYEFSDSEFKDICSLVYENTGIILSEEKRKLAYSRFSRRLNALNLDSFTEYCDIVKSGDQQEITHFTNAITTNLTSFYREAHHFDQLVDEIMPLLLSNPMRRIRIWSAGCSTGEEPYSIAMAVLDKYPYIVERDFKILATDIDSNVLQVASEGVYKWKDVTNMEKPEQIKKWLMSTADKRSEYLQVLPEVKRLIQFKHLNLLSQPWPMKGMFDVIFCRNVIIYFDRETQKQVISQFSAVQNPGSRLFIGHSESLKNINTDYTAAGRTSYTRNDLSRNSL